MTGYNSTKKELADRLALNGFRLILLTSTHTPNIDTQAFVSDVIAAEASDSNIQYTAGGVALTNVVVAQDNVNDRATINADDVALTDVNISDYQYAVIAQNSGTNASDRLIGYQNLGAQAQNGGDLNITIPANFVIVP